MSLFCNFVHVSGKLFNFHHHVAVALNTFQIASHQPFISSLMSWIFTIKHYRKLPLPSHNAIFSKKWIRLPETCTLLLTTPKLKRSSWYWICNDNKIHIFLNFSEKIIWMLRELLAESKKSEMLFCILLFNNIFLSVDIFTSPSPSTSINRKSMFFKYLFNSSIHFRFISVMF